MSKKIINMLTGEIAFIQDTDKNGNWLLDCNLSNGKSILEKTEQVIWRDFEDYEKFRKILDTVNKNVAKYAVKRNPDRINKVLKLIEKVWRKYPDLRLCQLIHNCFVASDLYYKEDEELIKALKYTYKEI